MNKILRKEHIPSRDTTVFDGYLYLEYDSDNNLIGSNLTPRQLDELKKYITADHNQ